MDASKVPQAACLRVFTHRDVETVAKALLEKAQEGDAKSIRLLAEMLNDTEAFKTTINHSTNVAFLPATTEVIFNIPSNGREKLVEATVEPVPSLPDPP